jgi:hypothetical protein
MSRRPGERHNEDGRWRIPFVVKDRDPAPRFTLPNDYVVSR